MTKDINQNQININQNQGFGNFAHFHNALVNQKIF